jgi:VanZ family protein
MFWAIVILILTGLPGNYFPEIHSFWDWLAPDKMIHLFMFGSFTYLVIWGVRSQYTIKKNRLRLIIITAVLGFFYGGLTEILQSTIFIRRDGNIYDFMANTLGGGLGILLFHLLYRKKYHSKEN